MNFQDRRMIPPANVYREARVGRQKGDAVLANLSNEGIISPERTPTGRILLSPHDGETLFEAFNRK